MSSVINDPVSGNSKAAGPEGRFHSATIAMHWLTLLLLIAVYTLIELKGYFPKGSETRNAVKGWHELLGIVVFLVVLARLYLRYVYRWTPPIVPEPPRWQMALAHLMEWTLYAFLIVMPILGWLVLSVAAKLDLPLGVHLFPLMSPDDQRVVPIENIHVTLGNIGYYLIGLHAAAALFHHYWMRDNTLRRMLP